MIATDGGQDQAGHSGEANNAYPSSPQIQHWANRLGHLPRTCLRPKLRVPPELQFEFEDDPKDAPPLFFPLQKRRKKPLWKEIAD
jgi:hypothetical protein